MPTDRPVSLVRFIPVACLVFVGIAAPAADPAWQPAPAEQAAIITLTDAVVAAGYPETRGAEFTRGKAVVSAQVGGQRSDPPLPSRLSTSQMTGDGAITYAYEIQGVHAHLANGDWLLGLRYVVHPDITLTVTVDGQPIDPATIVAEAAAAKPFHAETDAAKFLADLPEEQRARSAVVLDATVPLTFLLKLTPDDLPLATVALIRAGCPTAPLLAWAVADQRARSYWAQRYWTDAAPPFDPTGAYAWGPQAEKDWRAAHRVVVSEDAAVALRRAWHRQFRAWLMARETGCPVDANAAAAGAIATLDHGDPQGHAGRITALREQQRLPIAPPKGAGLPDLLRLWGPAPSGQPEFRVAATPNGISTTFAQDQPAYAPKAADADRLVALLADAKPSRFQDFGGVRSVGDNALRALAQLMQKDPRVAIGRDGDRPWTDQERASTAEALAAWWSEHGAEATAQMLEPTQK